MAGAWPVQITQRELATITPYARNPRQNDNAVEGVARSIKEFGFQQPIVVDSAGVIVIGHTRYKAAQRLGLVSVPVHVADDLSVEQITALRIADNSTGEAATWDMDLLPIELASLRNADYDIAETGLDPDLMAGLLDPKPATVTEDEVPEPPVDPITKPGDLWLLGDHRLLCGDSTKADDVERVMDGEKAEMMFTDPPYGVDYSGGVQFDGKGGMVTNNRERLANDANADIYGKFLPVCLPFVDGPCYLWFSDSKVLPVYQAVHDCGGIVSALLIWHKTNATYAAMNAQYKQRHEPLLYFKPKGSTLRWVGPTDACTLWEFKRDGVNDFHPTQKPVALSANAMKNHKADTVADFFAGSGSTFIAAEQLGRKCYGIEISPAYCDVIVKRWENLTGRTAELIEQ
jgi:DNA modification methylase